MKKNRNWIVVSNRLPVQYDAESGNMYRGTGGLVTAIDSIAAENKKIWIGNADYSLRDENWAKLMQKSGITDELHPVFIGKKQYNQYYNGMCNNVFWPLLHYESSLVKFRPEEWQSYKKVNQLFAQKIIEVAKPGDLVWLHDFHLFLVPEYLRKAKIDVKIGFFLHIPFPSSEIFRQLPVREEVLEGLLYADLIGFHDYSYLHHFHVSLEVILGLRSSMVSVKYNNHETVLGVYPVSIDAKNIHKQANSAEVKKLEKDINPTPKGEKLILGVDRLDYTKGLELKLKLFRALLENRPEWLGKVKLLQIAVPTRTKVPEYQALRRQIQQLVGEINGAFGKPDYVPVNYIHSSVSFKELLALYRLADILLVTSKRDGMNLVSLEFIAAQAEADPGVLLLSEFTGAKSILSHAITINPWDPEEVVKKIDFSLRMKTPDRIQMHKPMLEHLLRYTATDWANAFLRDLSDAGSESHLLSESSKSVATDELEAIITKEKKNKTQLIFFIDYDGTLVPITDYPDLAVLPKATLTELIKLHNKKNVELVVVSGRDKKFLLDQFTGFPISIAAEHGARFSADSKKWQNLVYTKPKLWIPIAEKVMAHYVSHVSESFIERKDFGVSWHYRRSPEAFASYQARRLALELEGVLTNYPVTVLNGKKVVEVRAHEVNKGSFALWFLNSIPPKMREKSLVITIGDDETDEDMFRATQDEGLSFKVGEGATSAKYRLKSQDDVMFLVKLLSQLF